VITNQRPLATINEQSFMNQDIQSTIKTFILNEYLPGEDPAALTDVTPLMTTGILDSIAVLKVVTFLENEFGITIEPHEAVVDNLNTLSDMVRLVMSKRVSPAP
jgi:acyl carrier protein